MLEVDPTKRPNIEEVLLLTGFPLEEKDEDTVTLEHISQLNSE